MTKRPVEVLLMEDDPCDMRLTMEGFMRSKHEVSVSAVKDGAEGMAFLRREGRYVDAPVPDLVVLDLNMPKKSGREVLADLKTDIRFQHLPVVVLSTSSEDRDILQAYQLHANSYVIKSSDLEEFFWAVQTIGTFWFTTVKLPRNERTKNDD